MSLFKYKYRIESNRLKNWDYSANAIYFLTFCSYQRNCIFGNIENFEMILNENGKIVENEILESIKIREQWLFHNWIVMPNHIHILLEIKKPETMKYNFSERKILPDDTDLEYENLIIRKLDGFEDKINTKDNSINEEIGVYLNVEMHGSASNDSQNQNVEMHGSESDKNIKKNTLTRKPKSISSFMGIFKSKITVLINELMNCKGFSVWQSNFHDHIVRDYQEYKKIFYYIENNPKNWNLDKFNPLNDK